MVLFILLLILLFLEYVLYMMNTVQSHGEKNIISYKDLPSGINIILVLGAGISGNGMPCHVLKDRLMMAMKIKKKIENGKILLSGDHGKTDYNEVGTMKDYIMKNDVSIKECDILLDHAGFSTYESIYRAKEVFKVDKMIIVTNRYHLPRALYIAQKIGIKAYGIPCDEGYYEDLDIYKERELLAQVKDYIFVNILKPKPRYLGKDIPINARCTRRTHKNF